VIPPRRVHLVGAGLAGLAAALRLTEAGVAVALHEAAPQAGGRCRSYDDATLGCRIDNGNHLLIAGNTAVMSYLRTTGATGTLVGPPEPGYPFLDLETSERWVLRPNQGRLPWWLLAARRRVPGTGPLSYLGALRLARVRPEQKVSDVLDSRSLLFRRLWRPLAVAALNTDPAEGSAALLARVLAESFGQGGAACRPLVPREGLSESRVDPALAYLRPAGGAIRFGARLRAIDAVEGRVTALGFDDGAISLAPEEAVVLAVTAPVAKRLLPELVVPEEHRAIVNAHYRVALPDTAPLFVGLVGGVAEWVFRKREVLSVTVSAADRLVDEPADMLAEQLWRDVVQAYELPPGPPPSWQVVKERRATFAATPAQAARRPPPETRWTNLALAGDWTATGLPATIEGATRSGFAAAAQLLGMAPRGEKRLSAADGRSKVAAPSQFPGS
jgi:squalene-associated FAD-dependent desaturase